MLDLHKINQPKCSATHLCCRNLIDVHFVMLLQILKFFVCEKIRISLFICKWEFHEMNKVKIGHALSHQGMSKNFRQFTRYGARLIVPGGVLTF